MIAGASGTDAAPGSTTIRFLAYAEVSALWLSINVGREPRWSHQTAVAEIGADGAALVDQHVVRIEVAMDLRC